MDDVTDSQLSLAHGLMRSAVKQGMSSFEVDPSFIGECLRELRERRLKEEVKRGAVSDAMAAHRLLLINAR